jgi:hypothetical protein
LNAAIHELITVTADIQQHNTHMDEIESDFQRSTDAEYQHKAELARINGDKKVLSEAEIHQITSKIDDLKSRTATVISEDSNPYRSQLEDLKAAKNPYLIQIVSIEDETNPYEDIIDRLQKEANPYSHSVDPNNDGADDLRQARLQVESDQKALDDFVFGNDLLTEDELTQIAVHIDELKGQLSVTNENPYAEQMVMLQESLKSEDDGNVVQLRDDESHLKILIKLLTDNKSFVRVYLVDQYLPRINASINDYLSTIESSHRVTINSDLSVDVIYMRQMISYGNLSRGEKLRVNLAVSLAFRDFMAACGKSCNLLCIDELLDSGGDSQFMTNVFGMLRHMPTTLFLISHREELSTELDQIMTVTKENGFTSLGLRSA